MKTLKYFSIIPVLIILLVFPSCQLNEKPEDTPTPSIINNEQDVTAVINGAYSQFNDASAFKYQGMAMFFLGADDIYAASDPLFITYSSHTFNSVNTSNFWNKLYSPVANANDLIATLDKLKLDSAFQTRAYGEAYFLRAFSYYYLVRLYGGVPLRTKAVDINSDFYLHRNTIEEVYAQIFKDFKKASTNVTIIF